MPVLSARGRYLGTRTTDYRRYVNKETGEVKEARKVRHVLVLDESNDVIEVSLADDQAEPGTPWGSPVVADVKVRSYQGATYFDLVGLSPVAAVPAAPKN